MGTAAPVQNQHMWAIQIQINSMTYPELMQIRLKTKIKFHFQAKMMLKNQDPTTAVTVTRDIKKDNPAFSMNFLKDSQ